MYRAIANTIMALKITKKMKISSLPYTRKEILEQEHTDLWNRAEAAVNRLIDLQQKLVMGLPDSKQGVPTDIEMLENKDVQLGYLKHLHLISLYGLAKKVVEIIEMQCRTLAEKNGPDVEDAKTDLTKTMDVFESIPWDELEREYVVGLFWQDLLKRLFKHDWMVEGTRWPFSDYIGVIKYHGLKDESLWQDIMAGTLPTNSNISRLLDDDNEMIRIY